MSPTAIPISALLAPQPPHDTPRSLLPSPSAAVLGPLPPTTPLHLVLNYIALSDLPDYEYSSSTTHETGRHDADAKVKGKGKEGRSDDPTSKDPGKRGRSGAGELPTPPARALIITGNKDGLFHALQEDDEDWMRDHGSDYGVMTRLKRCDIRYCSTPQQLTLLLALLTSYQQSEGDDATYNLSPASGLVILYDVAALFMHWEGGDENASGDINMDSTERSGVEPYLVFNDDTTMSSYLDIISAARSCTAHLSSTRKQPVQLVVLEPSISDTSTLPIVPRPVPLAVADTAAPGQAQADRFDLPTQSRSKRVTVLDGLSWMLGRGNVGVVGPEAGAVSDADPAMSNRHSDSALTYVLDFPDAIEPMRYLLRRRRCGRGEWASKLNWNGPDGQEGEVEGDQGGWRWEWSRE